MSGIAALNEQREVKDTEDVILREAKTPEIISNLIMYMATHTHFSYTPA